MAGRTRPDDLGPGIDQMADIVRDLEAYARGTAHAVPPGLLSRVLTAVAREAPPTPPVGFARAVAALAPRDAARAFGAMLALMEGRRRAGPGLRLRAAAMVIATILLVGSAAVGATLGGARLVSAWLAPEAGPSITATDLVSPTPDRTRHGATPTPVAHSPHPSARPGESEGPHETAEPSEPAESAEPSDQSDDASDDPGDDGGGGSGGATDSPGPSADD